MSFFVQDLFFRQKAFLYHQSVERTLSLCRSLAASSVPWVLSSDLAGLSEIVQSYQFYKDISFIILTDMDGKIMAHSETALIGKYLSDQVSLDLIQHGKELTVIRDDEHFIEMGFPILRDTDIIGWARVRRNRDQYQQALNDILVDGLVFSLVAILVGVFCAYGLSRSLTQRLHHLVHVVEATFSGRRDTRADTGQQDELGILASGFNRMLDQLVQEEHKQSLLKQDLEILNQQLEQGIEKRTRELFEARTDVQIADKKLREQNIYLESILANIPSMVFVKEAQSLRFVHFNKEGEHLLGYNREELIGKNDYDFFPKEQADFFTAKDREILEKGELLDIAEEPIQTRHKGLRILHTRKVTIPDEAGNPKLLLGISEDITERKTAETQMAHYANRLEQSNKALTEFAYIASHDLKEPVRVMMNLLQLFLQRYQSALEPNAIEILKRADAAGLRMMDLINSLLTYSRIDTQQQPFRLTDLNKTLKNVLSSLQLLIQEHQAKITHDALPSVQVDAQQWEQLLQNLLGNAVKFHGETTPQIHLGVQEHEDHWIFSIADNGIGIAPEHFETIFGMFKRLHGRTEYEGSGIGLSVCKKIVERHGGTIKVESQAGQGTTFYWTLPKNNLN
ncbi:MAG: PAS domain-containing protein [SAR324 cluster bacterium]|nr:PAS domain-containing protein [SAR324 cluster bacterium]